MLTFEADMADAPFRPEEWQTISHLRIVAAQILHKTQTDKSFAAKMRVQDQKSIPWSKSWLEELYPFKVLADHISLSDDVAFCWTPRGAADFEIRAGGKAIRIQSTMAYAEREGSAGVQGGHVRKLEMKKYNADGFSFGGGLVTEPRARSEEDDVNAWRVGIERALRKKLKPGYTGCWLLIYAPNCHFDTIEFEFDQVVIPAIEQVGREAWEQVFDGLYVLDKPPPCAFVELRRNSSRAAEQHLRL